MEPLKVKRICPNCFSNDGLSIVLEKRGKEYVCPRCGSRYVEDEEGNLRRL